MEEQTILDMCQSRNVKVSIEYDYDWAEWIITISSRNTTKAINHIYRYKNTDIKASGIGSYEYLRDQIEGLKNKVKSLEEEVRHLQWERDFLAKQVEHLQSCLDLEKDKE